MMHFAGPFLLSLAPVIQSVTLKCFLSHSPFAAYSFVHSLFKVDENIHQQNLTKFGLSQLHSVRYTAIYRYIYKLHPLSSTVNILNRRLQCDCVFHNTIRIKGLSHFIEITNL